MIYAEAFALSAVVWLVAFYALRDLNVLAPAALFAAAAIWAYTRLPASATTVVGTLAAAALGLAVAVVGHGAFYYARLEPRPPVKDPATMRRAYRLLGAAHIAAGVTTWALGSAVGLLVR